MTRNIQNPVLSVGAELFRWLQDDGHLKVLESKTYFCPVNWDGDEIERGHELGQLWAVNAIVSRLDKGKDIADVVILSKL